jgi:hypothetical protein
LIAAGIIMPNAPLPTPASVHARPYSAINPEGRAIAERDIVTAAGLGL